VISEQELPKKRGVEFRLAYSQDRKRFYVHVLIPGYKKEQVYFLQCDEQIHTLVQTQAVNESDDLDGIIQKGQAIILHCYGCANSLDLYLCLKNQPGKDLAIACNEDVLDLIFLKSPSLNQLLNRLEEWINHPQVSFLTKELKKGFLNPVREILLCSPKVLAECPESARDLILEELFYKRGLAGPRYYD
jgi:hypothetical protein